MITQEIVKEHFDYDPSGWLIRKKAYRNVGVGKRAGWIGLDGYVAIMFQRKVIRAHRLIFLWHHGYLPALIDHIDGDKANNKIENLRETTKRANSLNSERSRNAKRVSWNSSIGYWMVQVPTDDGRVISKHAKTKEEAEAIAAHLYSIHIKHHHDHTN